MTSPSSYLHHLLPDVEENVALQLFTTVFLGIVVENLLDNYFSRSWVSFKNVATVFQALTQHHRDGFVSTSKKCAMDVFEAFLAQSSEESITAWKRAMDCVEETVCQMQCNSTQEEFDFNATRLLVAALELSEEFGSCDDTVKLVCLANKSSLFHDRKRFTQGQAKRILLHHGFEDYKHFIEKFANDVNLNSVLVPVNASQCRPIAVEREGDLQSLLSFAQNATLEELVASSNSICSSKVLSGRLFAKANDPNGSDLHLMRTALEVSRVIRSRLNREREQVLRCHPHMVKFWIDLMDLEFRLLLADQNYAACIHLFEKEGIFQQCVSEGLFLEHQELPEPVRQKLAMWMTKVFSNLAFAATWVGWFDKSLSYFQKAFDLIEACPGVANHSILEDEEFSKPKDVYCITSLRTLLGHSLLETYGFIGNVDQFLEISWKAINLAIRDLLNFPASMEGNTGAWKLMKAATETLALSSVLSNNEAHVLVFLCEQSANLSTGFEDASKKKLQEVISDFMNITARIKSVPSIKQLGYVLRTAKKLLKDGRVQFAKSMCESFLRTCMPALETEMEHSTIIQNLTSQNLITILKLEIIMLAAGLRAVTGDLDGALCLARISLKFEFNSCLLGSITHLNAAHIYLFLSTIMYRKSLPERALHYATLAIGIQKTIYGDLINEDLTQSLTWYRFLTEHRRV